MYLYLYLYLYLWSNIPQSPISSVRSEEDDLSTVNICIRETVSSHLHFISFNFFLIFNLNLVCLSFVCLSFVYHLFPCQICSHACFKGQHFQPPPTLTLPHYIRTLTKLRRTFIQFLYKTPTLCTFFLFLPFLAADVTFYGRFRKKLDS